MPNIARAQSQTPIFSRVLAAVFAVLFCGCSVISGDRPLPVTTIDREQVGAANERVKFNIPLIKQPLTSQRVEMYKVAFDGTMNDANHVSADNPLTIVGHISKRVAAHHYYPGPGKQNLFLLDWLDGLIGFTSEKIAEQAKDDFFQQAGVWLKDDPGLEIRVFVTGFSRGAAIARHFMNIVERDWARSTVGSASSSSTPHFYALLYDTVATGQTDNLELTLPASLDYLVHMVAVDEPRSFFVPIIDDINQDASQHRSFINESYFAPFRVNLIELPGAHSDIGGAYKEGIGDRYRDISEQLLYKLGLITQTCWYSSGDQLVRGKHDSRGFLDMVFGRVAPNSDASVRRTYSVIEIPQPSAERSSEIDSRLNKLSLANYERGSGLTTARLTQHPTVFKLRREGSEVQVLSYEAAGLIDGATIKFYVKDGVRRLDYRFVKPYEDGINSLALTDRIWERLPEGRVVTLSYGTLSTGDKTFLATHVDGVLVSADETTPGPVKHIQSMKNPCELDDEGNTVSSLKVLILHARQADSVWPTLGSPLEAK